MKQPSNEAAEQFAVAKPRTVTQQHRPANVFDHAGQSGRHVPPSAGVPGPPSTYYLPHDDDLIHDFPKTLSKVTLMARVDSVGRQMDDELTGPGTRSAPRIGPIDQSSSNY